MTDLRRLRIAALALGLMTATVSPGCGTSIPADILIARNVIGVIDMVVTAIGNFSNAYFTGNPNAAEQAKIQAAIADVQASAAAAEALVNGGAALNGGDVAQAFGDFEAAYADLLALVKQLGVVSAPLASRVGVEQVAGRLVVPSVEALLPKGVDMAKVHARAAAVLTAQSVVACAELPDRRIAVERDVAAGVISQDQATILLRMLSRSDAVCAGDAVSSAIPGDRRPGAAPQHDSGAMSARTPAVACASGPMLSGARCEPWAGALQSLAAVPLAMFSSDWDRPHECSPEMHDLSPAFPGAACVADGKTWRDVVHYLRKDCSRRPCEIGFRGSLPLADAALQLSGALAFDMSQQGRWR